MIAASHTPIPPRSIAAAKMPSLPQNPPVGGTPASDTMNAVIATPSNGADFISPAKSSIRRLGRRSDTAVATANDAEVHHRVDQDVGDRRR